MQPFVFFVLALWLAITGATAAATLPVYPFNITRSAALGETVTGAKGSVIYSERSLGQAAYYLSEALPQGDGPVALSTDDELTKSTFGPKDAPTSFYCAAKFGEPREERRLGKVRPTLCFRDADNDQLFEAAATGLALVEIGGLSTGFGMSNRVTLVGEAMPIVPLRYQTRLVRPETGHEGLIELRYDGLIGKTAKFTATFRAADAPAAIYETRIELQLDAAAPVTLAFAHPALSQPDYAVHDPKDAGPVTTMSITLTEIDNKHVVGRVDSAFADWQWYRQPCPPPPTPAQKAEPDATQPPSPTSCETMYWRDGMILRGATPKARSTSKITAG